MNDDALKLTIYLGERDRANGGFLADALVDAFARHRLRTSVMLRGAEGFGLKQRLQTQRVLSLSEDLPLVAVGVDTRERIEPLLDHVGAIAGDGLITLERALLLGGPLAAPPGTEREAAKLTVYLGRRQRADGRPAHRAVVDLLHRRGVSGATVLLGVDGTAHGERRRARFLGANADVPLMVISVGDGDAIARVLPELGRLVPGTPATLERVRVCKRDGRRVAALPGVPDTDEDGLGLWQKLMVFTSEQAKHAGRPVHLELVRRLRQEAAAGATALRGVWGYHGGHVPHGDRFLSLARHVPVVTVVLDTPAAVRRWFAIADELTTGAGLITSETVPALRATTPAGAYGGLRLARRVDPA